MVDAVDSLNAREMEAVRGLLSLQAGGQQSEEIITEDELQAAMAAWQLSRFNRKPSQAPGSAGNVLANCKDASDDEEIAIGFGNAKVPAKIFNNINWEAYTTATRKLLTAVFPRRVLATHSLTGKPSPAFPNKEPKKKLDEALVYDIVMTVGVLSKVPENIVRNCITTKCADESKMMRNERKKRRAKK